MKSRSVSIAWKIMMVPNLASLVFGLIFVASYFSDAFINIGFEAFTGQSLSAISPKIAEYILFWFIMCGVTVLAVTVLGFAVTLMSFRRGERWSWYALLIGNTLGWGYHTVSLLFWAGEIPNAMIGVVMLLITYIALAISAKDILSKKIASDV